METTVAKAKEIIGVVKSAALRMDPDRMIVLHLLDDGGLVIDYRSKGLNDDKSDTLAFACKFTASEAQEISSFVSVDVKHPDN